MKLLFESTWVFSFDKICVNSVISRHKIVKDITIMGRNLDTTACSEMERVAKL